jgi:hypothetical protein
MDMQYLKVKWIHTNPEYPVWLYSELDNDRWETRKVEVFSNGTIGFADSAESFGTTELGIEPIPRLEEIVSDPQFLPEEISRNEFDEIWANRRPESN